MGLPKRSVEEEEEALFWTFEGGGELRISFITMTSSSLPSVNSSPP